MKYAALFLLIGLLLCINFHSNSALDSKCPKKTCSISELEHPSEDQCQQDSKCRITKGTKKGSEKPLGKCCKICNSNKCV
ncbi:unnamed protein product [Allacma fusca]|uniref:Uncharacterized protein n=1 Tax=Allacma fusca TaxID=39272 RepID=A0A8J2K3T7_9HEXA|nr:unnamed protein product [Allacma fusca]